ncbi:MAG: endospore germination permease [Clostridia bacterium]|nr:endospore germination permease [Clostridia bacterium]
MITNSQKISPRQLMALLFISRIVLITITFPMMVGIRTPQDGWIAALIGTALSVPLIAGMALLGLRFPNKTIIEYSQIVLGKFLGRIVGALLIGYWIVIAASMARALGESYVKGIMVDTPILVFMAVITFLGANTARCGIEVAGRMAEFSMPLVIFSLMLVSILPFDTMRFRDLLPILPTGFGSVLDPMGVAVSFFAEFNVVGMLLPYVNRPKNAVRYSVYAVLASGLIATWICIALAAAFGEGVSALEMPVFSLSSLISLGQFLERIEIIPMGIWTLSAGIKLALYLWASAEGLAQLLGVERSQTLIYPLGAICAAFGVLFFESDLAMDVFQEFENWGIYSLLLTLTVMAILWLGALFRSRPASNAGRRG